MKSDEIAGLLPAVFRSVLQNDATLQTILDTMAAMLDPVEVRLAELDEIFDAIRTDDAFLPMLAQWVDLSWLLSSDSLSVDPGRLRMLIEESHTLSQERGTADGLVRFLEMATGVRVSPLTTLRKPAPRSTCGFEFPRPPPRRRISSRDR